MAHKKAIAPHWADDVSQCDISELHDIKANIEKHLVNAATSFVEIGHALNRARVLIRGDLEFGQWRDQHTPFTARQANNYMKVARKFSTHSLVPKTSLSVLVELSSAPPELTEKVEKQIDEGKPVKRADVQAEKKKIRDAEQKSKQEAKDADNLPPISNGKQASISKKMASEPPLVDGKTGEVISPTLEEESNLPEGDYEMIAVTEDEFDLVIAALEFYAADGNDDAMTLVKRLNQ